MVSAHGYLQIGGTPGAKNFQINKNETEIAQSLNGNQLANGNTSRGLPPKLLSVAEGDEITFNVYGASGDVVVAYNPRNYITVEVID